MKHVAAFYGKIRIPTIGHAKAAALLNNIAVKHRCDAVVGVSNALSPLSEDTRDSLMRSAFGKAKILRNEPYTKNLITFLSHLSENYDSISLVCGSDRYDEYKSLMERCNGTRLFSFDSWNVVQAGSARSSPNMFIAETRHHGLVKTASSSAVQKLAESKNYAAFKSYLPKSSERIVKRAFNEVLKSSMNESIKHAEFVPMVNSFVKFAGEELELKDLPKVYLRKNTQGTSFGGYYPHNGEIHLSTKDRHPMDVFRTLAHELVHHKQNEDGRITDPTQEGSDGSDIENEANALAGVLMRKYGKANPKHFGLASLIESNKPKDREEGTDSLVTIYSKGTPGQGKKKKDRHEEGEYQDSGPLNTGIGATFGGNERPYGGYTYSESVERWTKNPKTISKYRNRYGSLSTQKLHEDASVIDSRLKRLKESTDKGMLDMGMMSSQSKDDPGFSYDDNDPIRILPKINNKNSKNRRG